MINDLAPAALTTDRTITANAVPQWQTFNRQATRVNKAGWMRGFHSEGEGVHNWVAFEEYSYAFAELNVEETEDWEGDLLDIAGIVSLATVPEGVKTLEEYATEWRTLGKDISEAALEAALADPALNRLMSGEATLKFFGWDDRVFLDDPEALEKLAEAQCIARKLGKKVPVRGSVVSHHLSYKAVRGLREEFELRVIAPSPQFSHNFFVAMREMAIPYYVCELPSPLRGTVFLFPKTNRKSVQVATRLSNSCVMDLGKYLEDLAANQNFATND